MIKNKEDIFEEIISFNQKFNYKLIKSKNNNKVYKITSKINYENNTTKQIFILKINNEIKDIEEFHLKTQIITKLHENNFNTPELYYNKFSNNLSYFIFEYINTKENINLNNNNNNNDYNNSNNTEHLIKKERIQILTNFLCDFYTITDNINPYNENLKIANIIDKINSKTKNNPTLCKIEKSAIEIIKSHGINSYCIITDVNASNIIMEETTKKYYMIDFDEICFGDYEFDISDYFSEIILEINFKKALSIIIKMSKTIKEKTNKQIIPEKIINYTILNLIRDLRKTNSKALNNKILWKINLIHEQKEILISFIKNNI